MIRFSTRVATGAARAVLVLATLAGAGALGAQSGFGQNKVQYRSFDWHVLHGPHLDVYYYRGESDEESVARLALAYGEESYEYLVRRFDTQIRSRIPLIVYASHSDFEQTNVLPFVPPEGVLGVT